MREYLIGEMNLTVNTLCGLVKYDALKSLGGLHTANDPQLITLSTITSPRPEDNVTPRLLNADLYVKTRDGDVTIEKTM